jgi:hypothetical protein
VCAISAAAFKSLVIPLNLQKLKTLSAININWRSCAELPMTQLVVPADLRDRPIPVIADGGSSRGNGTRSWHWLTSMLMFSVDRATYRTVFSHSMSPSQHLLTMLLNARATSSRQTERDRRPARVRG